MAGLRNERYTFAVDAESLTVLTLVQTTALPAGLRKGVAPAEEALKA